MDGQTFFRPTPGKRQAKYVLKAILEKYTMLGAASRNLHAAEVANAEHAYTVFGGEALPMLQELLKEVNSTQALANAATVPLAFPPYQARTPSPVKMPSPSIRRRPIKVPKSIQNKQRVSKRRKLATTGDGILGFLSNKDEYRNYPEQGGMIPFNFGKLKLSDINWGFGIGETGGIVAPQSQHQFVPYIMDLF
jgi:hypothetical protein